MKKNNPLVFTIISFFIILVTYGLFIFSTNEQEEDKKHQNIFNSHYKIHAINLPSEISFCDESVPINQFDIKERLDRELLVNTYWQSNTLLYIKKAHKYFPIIEPILEKNNIPNDFKYLALIESGLSNVVSPSGAAGFWQIMKATGKEKGLIINNEIDERYHLEKATQIACDYLNEAYQKFGSWTLAAASYNSGMNGLQTQIDKQHAHSYYDLVLNEETARYVFRILAAKEILSNYEKYGFHLREKDLYTLPKTKSIIIDSSITDIGHFAMNLGTNYKTIKLHNPWIRRNYLSNSKRDTFYLKIPANLLKE